MQITDQQGHQVSQTWWGDLRNHLGGGGTRLALHEVPNETITFGDQRNFQTETHWLVLYSVAFTSPPPPMSAKEDYSLSNCPG